MADIAVDGKVGIYIDGGYIDKVLKKLKIKIDYEKFVQDICKKTNSKLMRAYYYDCLPYKDDERPTDEDKQRYASKQSFLVSLDRTPFFEVKRGRLDKHKNKCFKCNNETYQFRQKLIDNLITVDIVSHSWRGLVDKIVLVSGDADFVPAIKEAKDAGIITYLFYSSIEGTYIHDQIRNLVDNRVEMTEQYLKTFKK
jgi:uncharacterized LabA/DUF88 family protein